MAELLASSAGVVWRTALAPNHPLHSAAPQAEGNACSPPSCKRERLPTLPSCLAAAWPSTCSVLRFPRSRGLHGPGHWLHVCHHDVSLSALWSGLLNTMHGCNSPGASAACWCTSCGVLLFASPAAYQCSLRACRGWPCPIGAARCWPPPPLTGMSIRPRCLLRRGTALAAALQVLAP